MFEFKEVVIRTELGEKKSIEFEDLPEEFLTQAKHWYDPVGRWLIDKVKHKEPIFVGLNGAQGSGKSTLAQYWAQRFNHQGVPTCVLSIDDFYLTHAERLILSTRVHPLLLTRGVPGTHNIIQALAVIDALKQHTLPISLPRFNKADDDPWPKAQWPVVNSPVKIIILEGWCVGCQPVKEGLLEEPINALEAQEDESGIWRRYVNDALGDQYQKLFAQFDAFIMLRAPSFECVFDWRLEQEQKLAQAIERSGQQATKGLMNEAQLARFIAHYERITRQALKELPEKADVVMYLDEQRKVKKIGGCADLKITREPCGE